uniref:Uncharacterized protein n=1 Tax=Rhizophora mucronata TaxID=61149 RepID=A0A2P2NU42_RHIMU
MQGAMQALKILDMAAIIVES